MSTKHYRYKKHIIVFVYLYNIVIYEWVTIEYVNNKVLYATPEFSGQNEKSHTR